MLVAPPLDEWPAVARAPPIRRLDSARAHSQEGDAYYKLEKYTSAIAEYEQAYLAKPESELSVQHRASVTASWGRGPEAIKFYRRFLKDAPNAPNRAVAEKHIRDLEETGQGTQPVAPGPSSAPAAAGRAAARFGDATDGAADRATALIADLRERGAQPGRRRTDCTHLHAGVDDANRRERHRPLSIRVASDLF